LFNLHGYSPSPSIFSDCQNRGTNPIPQCWPSQKDGILIGHAACLANRCARAFFPSFAASAMLSKKAGERSIGTALPAQ
jgi:hypothetical protein